MGIPGNIPNPAVKRVSADGTWRAASWESKKLPTSFFLFKSSTRGLNPQGTEPASRTQRIDKRCCRWSASNLGWDVEDNEVGGFFLSEAMNGVQARKRPRPPKRTREKAREGRDASNRTRIEKSVEKGHTLKKSRDFYENLMEISRNL